MSDIKIMRMDNEKVPIANAVIHNGLVYVSGQAALDTSTMKPTAPDIQAQTRETLRRVEAILKDAGSSVDKTLMVRVYLTDVKRDFGAMNEVFKQWAGDHRPARTTVGAPLAIDGLLVEIDAVAAVD